MNRTVFFDLLKTEAQKLVGNLNSLDKFADKEQGRWAVRKNIQIINELFNELDREGKNGKES
jgi:hypothetical protein